MITAVRDRLPALEHLWRLREELDKLTAAGGDVSDETAAERAKSATAADLATVIYTSGTTGRPKGCELTTRTCSASSATRSWGRWPPSTPSAAPPRCCSCRSRTSSRGSSRSAALSRDRPRPLRQHGEPAARTGVVPALLRARRARVFEKVYNGAEAKAVADGKGKIFARAAATAVAYSERLTPPPAPGCGCEPSTRSSTGSFTTSSAALGGRATLRSPAARRSLRGSGTSSAASASPCSRGTGSPRPARRCR